MTTAFATFQRKRQSTTTALNQLHANKQPINDIQPDYKQLKQPTATTTNYWQPTNHGKVLTDELKPITAINNPPTATIQPTN